MLATLVEGMRAYRHVWCEAERRVAGQQASATSTVDLDTVRWGTFFHTMRHNLAPFLFWLSIFFAGQKVLVRSFHG